jgi:hypothetical protein
MPSRVFLTKDLPPNVTLSTCHDSKVKSGFVSLDMIRGFESGICTKKNNSQDKKKQLIWKDKQANNCKMYADLYTQVISYASGPLTSRNYRHKLDADQDPGAGGGGQKGGGCIESNYPRQRAPRSTSKLSQNNTIYRTSK